MRGAKPLLQKCQPSDAEQTEIRETAARDGNFIITPDSCSKTFNISVEGFGQIQAGSSPQPLTCKVDFRLQSVRGQIFYVKLLQDGLGTETVIAKPYYVGPTSVLGFEGVVAFAESGSIDLVLLPKFGDSGGENHTLVQYFTSPVYDAFPIAMTSSMTGYLTSFGFEESLMFLAQRESRGAVHVPVDNAVMISFSKIQYLDLSLIESDSELVITNRNGTQTVTQLNISTMLSARIYTNTSTVVFRVTVVNAYNFVELAIKMLFSFHSENAIPERIDGGLFNCSVPNYPNFRQHLDCNFQSECQDRRDETGDCPFSSAACNGQVASGDKCFFVVHSTDIAENRPVPTSKSLQGFSWNQAARQCKVMGGQLASVTTTQEISDLHQRWKFGKILPKLMYLGLTSKLAGKPFMYRYVFSWLDRSVVYVGDSLQTGRVRSGNFCGVLFRGNRMESAMCEVRYGTEAVCERNIVKEERATQSRITLAAFRNSSNFDILSGMKTPNSSVTACPKGHWTHSFLTCDPRSDCGIEHYIFECQFGSTSPDAQSDTLSYSQNLESAGTGEASFSMFMCEDGVSRVHYTLVCDWRHDCLDRSDETFCWHEPCEGFTCSNRQCVPNAKRCDNFANCLDESDEENCPFPVVKFELLTETCSIVDFTGQGGFTQTPMNGSDPCPDTHYRCGGQSKFCLPVYTRCNGYNDCLEWEDEVDCDNVTCPGFYRCLDSSVCVHTQYLCDGWPQCPQHDDEWMCQEHHHCPSRCSCQGHAFVCHEFFSVEQYPHLRYLEITGASVVDIAHLTNNTYLVYLALTNCSVTHLPGVALPNLQVLDLSDNLLTQVNVSVFLNLRNLQTLQLAGNPISQLVSTDIVNTASSSVLAHVDLSRSKLAEFDCGSVSQFQSIRGLNLSFSPVEKLNDGGFSCLPSLQSLDVRGCPLGEYVAGVFQGLTQLSVIYASDYRLCCQHMIPKQLPKQPTCITASEDPVSSCENLLKHKTYQIVLIVCSILAVLANPVCVVVRYTRLKEPFRNVSGMLVTNLMMSNSLMGLYSAIVSGADELYRGHYVLFEKSWTRGVACKVAGHFFVMSTLVSAFSVLFLTLAGFVTRRFPRCTKLHFDCRSTLALCLAAWGIGFALAAIPRMPVFSQWKIHDQRGVCALPVLTNSQDSGFHYSFAIQTMYMILSVCGCAVQIFVLVIAKKDRAKSLLIQPSSSMHGEANVVVVNCLCLAAHAASGLVMRFDAVSSAAVFSAIQIFSLPVPSALNPVLYTINRVREQRRREMEARLLQLLKLRARTQAKA